MVVRILTPIEPCCEPEHLALKTKQRATCKKGVRWVAVDAQDNGGWWRAKWSLVRYAEEVDA
ncbi:hypothetical protein EDF22_0612 [Rathayibacter sp. PhB127]|nr:hypothetical protein EDF22_0612 [Rathayibacter sp. PhB127]